MSILDDVVAGHPEAMRELAELREALQAAGKWMAQSGEANEAVCKRLRMAEDNLAAMQERYRWRSPSEELPETDDICDVIFGGGARATGCYTEYGWQEVAITGRAFIDDVDYWRYSDDGPQEAGNDE